MAAKFLKNDETALRTCILYELADGKPISEAYKHFCKVMGDSAMEYRDFEFWFMRFARGDFDLNYDRSMDLKTRTLSDMPIEVLGKIVEKTTWKDVIALRQVCHTLQDIVEDTCLSTKTISLTLSNSDAILSIGGHSHVYSRSEDSESTSSDDTYFQSFLDMELMMKHPKLETENVTIEIQVTVNKLQKDSENHQKFAEKIKSSLLKINQHVQTVRFCSGYRVSYFLGALKPGKLEEVEIGPDSLDNTILYLDQTTMAKILKVRGYRFKIPLKTLIGLTCFDVEIKPLEGNQVLQLIQALLKSSIFEKCNLKWKTQEPFFLDLDEMEAELEPFVRKETDDPNYRLYEIEKENKKFELKLGGASMEMERKF